MRPKLLIISSGLIALAFCGGLIVTEFDNDNKGNTLPVPPIFYQPLAMGYWNKAQFTKSGGSLEIYWMPYTKRHSTGNNFDCLAGIVEVFNDDENSF